MTSPSSHAELAQNPQIHKHQHTSDLKDVSLDPSKPTYPGFNAKSNPNEKSESPHVIAAQSVLPMSLEVQRAILFWNIMTDMLYTDKSFTEVYDSVLDRERYGDVTEKEFNKWYEEFRS